MHARSFREIIAAKYNHAQPRGPAGDGLGGKWLAPGNRWVSYLDDKSPHHASKLDPVLRGGTVFGDAPLDRTQSGVVADLDAAIAASEPLQRTETFWRGEPSQTIAHGAFKADYTTVSGDRTVAEAGAGDADKPGVIYQITVPAGSRALNAKGARVLPRRGRFTMDGLPARDDAGRSVIRMRFWPPGTVVRNSPFVEALRRRTETRSAPPSDDKLSPREPERTETPQPAIAAE